MTETIYITGVVIPNGIADHEGDVLNKQDIKKIFTKYINRDTDTMHTRIKNEGVNVLANWISETDTTIAGKTAPEGSWLATFQITNPELIQAINDGSIKGLSLGSVSDKALTQKYWFLNKSINYKDLNDMEEVIPLFISFVDKPSNQYGFEVMTYDVYINKRASEEVEIMTEKEAIQNEEMISVSALEKLKDIFSINKAETEEEEKQEDEKVEKAETEETSSVSNEEVMTAINELPEKIATAVIDAMKEYANNDAEIEKEEDKEETDVETPEDKDNEADTDIDKEETVEINKRATVKNPTEISEPAQTFYSRTNRDMFGKKIKN